MSLRIEHYSLLTLFLSLVVGAPVTQSIKYLLNVELQPPATANSAPQSAIEGRFSDSVVSIMATAIQKNGIKSLPNGNGLVHHQMQSLKGYEHVDIVSGTANEKPIVAEPPHNEQCEPAVEQCSSEIHEEEPEIDIVINNVVCSFSVRCHLNLREIALSGTNVEYRKESGMVTMKLRRPYTTASIWSSGKITCTGATSEDAAKQAARRFARCLQKLGFNVRFNNYRVVNVLGTCSMPFSIRISSFSERHRGS
ncbi:hypothetical protein NQ317_005230 [Molorchus minor]|uniref:TATA box-binding protein-like 1 n=1 Tax=Molorchus minor TaxID=1323400 RepID=A0ABQ9JQS1_9CUCU|nr:hypothetical protein NQ317_005230 [Molorchus minor]